MPTCFTLLVNFLVLAGLIGGTTAQANQAKQPPKLSDAEVQKIMEALPASAMAKPAKHRRILVFWRCEGFFHGNGIAAGNLALKLMGEKTGTYETDITADYSAFDAENLAKYDAVVLNNTTHLKLSDEAKQNLLDFVRAGKGLVGIHAATDNFYDWRMERRCWADCLMGTPGAVAALGRSRLTNRITY
jgi:hypothetical protein